MLSLQPFGVRETHGILMQPGSRISASSDGFNWSSMYASLQHEAPYEGIFAPVRDQLIVLHRDGPVGLERTRGGEPCSRVVPPGGIHLVPGGIEFGVRLADALSTLHVYVRRGVIEEVAAEMLGGDPARLEIPPQILDSDASLRALLDAVIAALEQDDAATAIYSDYLARAIAAQLVRTYEGPRVRSRPTVGPSGFITPAVAAAVDYMHANLDQQFGLEVLAAAVNRSPSQFARQFRSDLGVPPHQYLISLRIEKAKRLLERTSNSIAEVAYECGFANQEHLTRLFRRHCSTTPAAYRRAWRN